MMISYLTLKSTGETGQNPLTVDVENHGKVALLSLFHTSGRDKAPMIFLQESQIHMERTVTGRTQSA